MSAGNRKRKKRADHLEELRFLILGAQREGNRLLARSLRPLGVTPAQGEVLRLLDDHQPLSLRELGELLVCESGNNPSNLVDRLVTMGLVQREVAKHDRRGVELTLTDEGLDRASQVAQAESGLYELLSLALGDHDPSPITEMLTALIAGQPSGHAMSKRKELNTS